MRTDSASRLIGASPESVFEVFVDAEAIARWLPPKGAQASLSRFDPKPGGAFQMTLTFQDGGDTKRKTSENSDTVEGKFKNLIYPERIEQEFTFVSNDPRFAGTMMMTWTFEKEEHGTLVTVVATNVPEGIRPEEHQAGMSSSLTNLAAYLAKTSS